MLRTLSRYIYNIILRIPPITNIFHKKRQRRKYIPTYIFFFIIIISSDLETKNPFVRRRNYLQLILYDERTRSLYIIILLCTNIHKSWNRSSDKKKNTKNYTCTERYDLHFYFFSIIIIFSPFGSTIIVMISKHTDTYKFYAIRFRSVTSRVCAITSVIAFSKCDARARSKW